MIPVQWRLYDRIAEAYGLVAERQCFARPARDLVDMLGLIPGARVLDVGAGTGAVAKIAASVVGPTGLVVALDPSLGMLRVLQSRCNARTVAGELPRLPYRNGAFDSVSAAFVLTHLREHTSALAAMTSVLRAGGRLAISSWAQSEVHTPPGRTWHDVARRFVRDEQFQQALGEALPLQEKFADPSFLEAALLGAGLAQVSVRQITYSIEMTTHGFAELRRISASGRLMQAVLPAAEWARFNAQAARSLANAYGEAVSFQMRANIAAGSKRAE